MLLAHFVVGRDNNFNLIRFVAAFLVLLTHSFTIVTGNAHTEPFIASLGYSLGTMSVDVFFVTSGFLVTASLINRESIIDFFWARLLRVYPALWVMLVLTIIWGALNSDLGFKDYFSHGMLYTYIFKCSTLIFGVSHTLPGLFEQNPYPSAVNGSLWTMPNELRMYLILAVVWALLFFKKEHKVKVFNCFVLLLTLASGIFLFCSFSPESASKLRRFVELFFMFFSGASYFIIRNYIKIKGLFFIITLITISITTFLFIDKFSIVYKLLIPYILFYLAYVPDGVIKKFNKLGDYSYGIYIYAFPIQQSIIYFFPKFSISELCIVSAIITLFFAITSWHIIEKPMLALKSRCANITKKYLNLY